MDACVSGKQGEHDGRTPTAAWLAFTTSLASVIAIETVSRETHLTQARVSDSGAPVRLPLIGPGLSSRRAARRADGRRPFRARCAGRARGAARSPRSFRCARTRACSSGAAARRAEPPASGGRDRRRAVAAACGGRYSWRISTFRTHCSSSRKLPGQRSRRRGACRPSADVSAARPSASRRRPLAGRRSAPAAARRGRRASCSQRRRADQVGAETVVEVLAETPRRHLRGQVAVGGGDDLALEAPVARVAEALERARLQHAEQLHLDRGSSSPISSRNTVPRRADLQPPGAVLQRAGERAAAVAEQLRLDQRRRQGREVQRVERAGEVGGEAPCRRRTACSATGRWRARPAPCRCPTGR